MTKLSLIIAGSRTVEPPDEEISAAALGLVLDAFHLDDSDPDEVARTAERLPDYIAEVICGKADGADAAGARWARALGIPVHEEPITAEDMKLGKYLGPRQRNRRMAIRATHAICFWDGASANTSDLVCRMVAREKPVRVIPTRKRPPRRTRQSAAR